MRSLSLLLVFVVSTITFAQESIEDLLGDDPKPAAPSANAPNANQPAPAGSAPEEQPAQPTESEAEGGEAEEGTSDEEATDEESEEAEEGEEDGEDSDVLGSIDSMTSAGALGFLRRGGLFMWPILVMAIIALGVIIERSRSLSMLSTDTAMLRQQVRDLLYSDQVEQALELVDGEEGPVPAVLGAGLRKYAFLKRLNHNPAEIQEQVNKAMEDYSSHIVAALERHLPILGTIASVAPMLGFLGTVAGMITSFDDIRLSMGETNIVEAAAAGISVALLTTCFGLIVGIPAFMAYNYFNSAINRNVLEVEETASELIEGVAIQVAMQK